MLNFIEQIIHNAVIKAFEQRLGLDGCCPAFMNEDLSNIIRKKSKNNWRSEEIWFFNPDYEKPNLVVIIYYSFYYRNIYAFLDQLKKR